MPIYTKFQEVYVKNVCVTALGNKKNGRLLCDSQNFAIRIRPINVGKKRTSFAIVPIEKGWQIY
jgi:hypothetical protein